MRTFAFNLLPEKPKEIVEKEIKRDNAALYFAFMPLLSICIAIGLILFNELLIKTRIEEWKKSDEARDVKIETYRPVVKRYSEFVDKSVLLDPQVSKDIAPERFFALSDELLQKLSEQGIAATINSYKRDSDGSFAIVVIFDNLNSSGQVLRTFESIEQIQNPNTDNLFFNSETQQTTLSVNFNLKVIEEEL